MNAWMAGVVAGLLASGAAQAALVDRGGGLLYDTVLNITWLQDANYARTSGFDDDGMMTWSQAKTWADNLEYGGYSNWRLAANSPVSAAWNYNWAINGSTDVSYNIFSPHSELSYMYYVNLGLHGYYTPASAYDPTFGIHGNGTTGGQEDVGLVDNLQSLYYWSGTAYEPDPASYAWYFTTAIGYQGLNDQSYTLYAWPVRPGDVAAPSSVPEPATLLLTVAGVLMTGLTRRCRLLSVR